MSPPLEDFYAHLSRQDLSAAASLLTADTVLHVPGRSVNTGAYTGRDAVMGFVTQASIATQGTLTMTVHRVLDDGEWSVALVTYTARRTDPDGTERHLENNLAHVARLDAGLVAESWLHSRDQYDVDAFWGAAS